MDKTRDEVEQEIELKMMKRDQLNKEIHDLAWRYNDILQQDDRDTPKDGEYVMIEPNSGKFPCYVRNNEYVVPLDKSIIVRKATKQEYRLFWDFDSVSCYGD
ncbi:MAG: hypothetical protein WC525_02990 [Candidatus Thermoplasmatota archaeon]